MAEQSSIDTTNRQLVGVQGRNVVVLNTTRIFTPDEAMAFAAWLVVMASVNSSKPFQDFYDAVCNA